MSSNGPDSEISERTLPRRFLLRACRGLAVSVLVIAALLLLPAGDAGWPMAWAFLAVFVVWVTLSVVYLRYVNPEIFVARSGWHAGTKGWDKWLVGLLLAAMVAIFLVAGFDHRYRWSSVPNGVAVLGFALFSVGLVGSTWVYGVNKFAEPGVRIQSERHQNVVSTGPYAIVRHPLYLASIFLVLGEPLALGSFWALIPVGVGILVLVVRTAWEDRTLQEELEGYKEYASRVCYRLFPGIW